MLALAASRSASARASRRWLAPRRLAVGATASLRPQRPRLAAPITSIGYRATLLRSLCLIDSCHLSDMFQNRFPALGTPNTQKSLHPPESVFGMDQLSRWITI